MWKAINTTSFLFCVHFILKIVSCKFNSGINVLDSLIRLWRTDPDTAPNFSIWRTTPPRPAHTHPFPDDLPAALRDALSQRGINSLYSHQYEAWSHICAGKNIVLATGTASGKTLAYNLPIIASLLTNTDARALYLFPTKALAQDQLSGLHQLQASIQNIQSAIYDGDTPQSQRALIRKNARLILSNPDMLHTGILPHHTNWADFFRNLRFIVIDEMHTYRGVFGSHVANVIRKLKRVAKFYGAAPQFILTSATIGNPKELAERLIESSIELIDHDGSSRGERHFLLYNPPVIDEALGLRKSSMMESVRLTQDLLANDIQSVVFARSRRSVEMMLTYLQNPTRPSVTSQILRSTPKGSRIWGGLGRGFAAIVQAIFHLNAARSKKVCAMEQSKPSLRPMHWNWESISAGWVRQCSSGIQAPLQASISNRVGQDAAKRPRYPCWLHLRIRSINSSRIIPIISSVNRRSRG